MSLYTNLLSYFKLDEASGNGLDAHGANELTDFATVTAATGKVSGARQFTRANSETLAKANCLNIGDNDFTLQAWIYADSVSIHANVISRRSTASSTVNYLLYAWTNSTIRFGVGFTNNTYTECVGPTLSTGTWYHVICIHDKTAEEIQLIIDDGTPTVVAYSGLAVASTTADNFRLGSNNLGNYWNGRIDEVGVWDRALTAGEITELYNSGNGLAYEDFAEFPTPPTTALGITAYAPSATGDPTLFEYFPAGSAGTSSATAATSIAITSTPPIGANIGLLLMAFDNTGSGADGDYSEVTGVTDNKGNSWHKLAEHSNTNGAPGAGATVSVWYCEVDPNTFESTITTATLSSSIASRCAAMIYCRSETLSLYAAEVLTNAVDASASYGSLTTSLAAKNRMYLRVCAQETAATSDFSATAGFSTLVNAVQVATMGLRAELKIATSASETSNPTTGASSDNASVFIALEADAAGGDGRHTAINTYSMTGVSDAADEVTQITPVSLGVNSNTADEVTQITPISLGINVSAEDEVTQIVMYSITSQPIPVPPTTVLGLTTFAPNVPVGESANPTIPPNLDGLGISAFAPVVTASQVANIEVPIVEIGYTAFAPDPPIPTFPTATSSATATPSSTPTSTVTATPSSTPTSTPTGTSSCTPTASSSTSASASISASGTNTSSASASFSASSSASCSATSTPSGTATGTPTSTPSGTSTGTPTSTSSGTPSTTATGTEEPPPDFDCCCCCSPIPGVIVIVVIR